MPRDKQKHIAAQHNHYVNNAQDYKNRNTARREHRRTWLDQLLAFHQCCYCGEQAIECLDFHHVDPTTKVDSVTSMVSRFRSLEAITEEITKCIVLCSNCHRKHHRNTIDIRPLLEERARVPAVLNNSIALNGDGLLTFIETQFDT